MEVLKDQGSTSVLVVLNQSAPYRAPMCSLWAGTVNFIYFRLSSWSSPPLTSQNYNQHKWISVWERTKDRFGNQKDLILWLSQQKNQNDVGAFCFFFSFQFKLLPEILTDLPYLPSQGRGWLAFPAMASLITEVKWDTVTDRRVS